MGIVFFVAQTHRKVPQGKALIRTGFGGAKVALDSGMFVIPVLHKVEEMDISLKTIPTSSSSFLKITRGISNHSSIF